MNCERAMRGLSLPGEGTQADAERRELIGHIAACGECASKARQQAMLRDALRSLPRREPPPDLNLRLRIVASRERSARLDRSGAFSRRARRLRLSFDELMRPFALPLTGGVCSAVFLFGMLAPALGRLAFSPAGDVPISLSTSAAVKSMAPIGFGGDAVVDLTIDGEGRMVACSVAGGRTPGDVRSIESALLFTVFQPATAFGQPTPGKIRISFRNSKVEVRG